MIIKSWTSIGYFSNSTGSSITSSRFSTFIGKYEPVHCTCEYLNKYMRNRSTNCIPITLNSESIFWDCSRRCLSSTFCVVYYLDFDYLYPKLTPPDLKSYILQNIQRLKNYTIFKHVLLQIEIEIDTKSPGIFLAGLLPASTNQWRPCHTEAICIWQSRNQPFWRHRNVLLVP